MAEKNEFLRRNQAELQKEMASLKSSTALILDQMDDSKLLKLQKDLRDLKSQVNKQPVIIQPDLSLPVQDGPDHEIVLRLMQKEINNLKSRTEDENVRNQSNREKLKPDQVLLSGHMISV